MKLILGLITSIILIGIAVWFGMSPYNSDNVQTVEVARSFATLKSAWENGDTNAVIQLCSKAFDPYSPDSIAQMNFNMTNQGEINRTALHPVSDLSSTWRFQPNAFRNWYSILTAPQYLLGQAYFYTKEDGNWKFTGKTDYHVD